MHPLATALLDLLSSMPEAAVAVVHPIDYRDHLRETLESLDAFARTTNQATVGAGCVGHFSRPEGKVTSLYVRQSVPRGEVRVGTVALLKEHQR